LLLLALTAWNGLSAQNVEGFFSGISQRLANKEYVRVNGRLGGSLGLNSFVTPDGALPRQAPFTWNLNAGLNFDILGIQAPFTAAVSSKNTVYNLPRYSFYGISPTYKWITLHGGDRSMRFSPYSLSGVNYRGAGLDLKPGKFRLSAMTGRLRRARIQDAGSIQDIETRLQRRGSGFQLGFEDKKMGKAGFSFFTSSDELRAGGPESDSLFTVTPEANMVLTFNAARQLTDFLRFDFEIARSVLTRDTRALALNGDGGARTLFGLFDPNVTTTAAQALNFNIGLSPKFGQIGIKYERIDPEYRTHGSLYFQNDLENFTASLAVPLLEGKLNLSTNAGVQRNDLAGQKASNLNRFIGSLSANIKFTERVLSGFSVSNFRATNRYKAISLASTLVDSIVLAQTQLAGNASTTLILNKESTRMLLVAANWQQASLLRNEVVDTSSRSNFSMLMMSYTSQPKGGPGSFSGTVMLHRNATPGVKVVTLGPNLRYRRKVFKDRGNLQAGAGYSIVWNDAAPSGGGVLQLTLGGGYALSKQQSLGVSSTIVHLDGGGARPGYTDMRLNVNYGLTFK